MHSRCICTNAVEKHIPIFLEDTQSSDIALAYTETENITYFVQ